MTDKLTTLATGLLAVCKQQSERKAIQAILDGYKHNDPMEDAIHSLIALAYDQSCLRQADATIQTVNIYNKGRPPLESNPGPHQVDQAEVDLAVMARGENTTRYQLVEQSHGRQTVTAAIESNEVIKISFDGYGQSGVISGHSAPVVIEVYDGHLRVIVWADINKEDPTHTIDLEGARESALLVL